MKNLMGSPTWVMSSILATVVLDVPRLADRYLRIAFPFGEPQAKTLVVKPQIGVIPSRGSYPVDVPSACVKRQISGYWCWQKTAI